MRRADKHQRVLPYWQHVQRTDITGAVESGEGGRDADKELRLPAGIVLWVGEQRLGDVVHAATDARGRPPGHGLGWTGRSMSRRPRSGLSIARSAWYVRGVMGLQGVPDLGGEFTDAE